ncbi:hypothetical protein WH50_06370 [Pokkaliibacter plantistimulans]|uniref:Uncharacterized protein n=1 Tax=Pokkaliibacter plantistimulans TaxID=1635171 RepID=A0ABX5LZM5_9GAMM|nr:hypothetical protein [Pokkaliibacter plantistimulans]PXF32079.1 hypothetical protein WH50_06370 [Pokkaliibacter plantistimulans]
MSRNKNDAKGVGASAKVHSSVVANLWLSNGATSPLKGEGVIVPLFSIDAFCTNKADDHRLSHELALSVKPHIIAMLEECKARIAEQSLELENQDEFSYLANVDVQDGITETYTLTISKGMSSHLTSLFLNLFVLQDRLQIKIHMLSKHGLVSKKSARKMSSDALKALKACMDKIHVFCLQFHRNRKELISSVS